MIAIEGNQVCNFLLLIRIVFWFQSGSSPLLVASYKGNAEIVRTLLKYHARVDVFDEVLSDLVT